MPEPSLERVFLGEEPDLTVDEIARRAGVSVEDARRLWRSLGFAEGGDQRAFTTADAEALVDLSSVVGDGVIDLDLALNITRGLGLSMARLADWEVGAIVQPAEERFRGEEGPDSRRRVAQELVERYGDTFDRLLSYAWRRHVIAAVARMEAAMAIEEDPGTTHVTVGFADLVNFTSLSNELSRDRIGDLVEVFEVRCGDVVANQGGRFIKSMGDAVLFSTDDAEAAFRIAEGIIRVIGRDKRMPDVRLGLASGLVVMRLGDVFGPPVNLAARLTGVARRNRIIVDHATAALLPSEEIETRALPERPVRGFGIVEPLAARRL
ncbi:adenylate/guanylate cyclase domain-containing protein [Nocardioides panacisoli]|uniref:adenylate/guanylate cyclase domain-containing protein n=1 Tax=Nocardioides panacisoli TaxID=627624 RepID=UPI001C62ECF1|nr:adenylate/guanylate cyclase domain-containing protein [Nocardioides panacisoli]QYJ04376.1 adenylate/guanylate cyclase domain-containing protein [Nocardioides panacisoli]